MLIRLISLILAPPMQSQGTLESSTSQVVTPAPYPNTADGLRLLLRDVLAAARNGDKQKVAAFVKDMEIPDYETWHRETYGGSADTWYEASLEQNDRWIQELFAKLAQEEGDLFIRSINDSPNPGKGLEWGWLQSLKQPVAIYFASWKRPVDPTNSQEEGIGYFMYGPMRRSLSSGKQTL